MSKIVIDLLGIQAEYEKDNNFSYSVEFIKELLKLGKNYEIRLVVSDLYPKSIEPIRAIFNELISQENILIWRSLILNNESILNIENRANINRLLRHAFISSLNPDLLHLTSFYDDGLYSLLEGGAKFNLDVPVTASIALNSTDPDPLDQSSELNMFLKKFRNDKSYRIVAIALLYFDQKNQNLQKLPVKNLSNQSKDFSQSRHSSGIGKIDAGNNALQGAILELEPAALERRWREILSSPKTKSAVKSNKKPTLAYVSPLPPEKTGIAAYSAEILPFLSKYYEIICVTQNIELVDPRIRELVEVRDVGWMRANSSNLDRVVYHFGNSPFHQHMPLLLKEIPGVVVLHDFFLGHLMAFLEHKNILEKPWLEELQKYHGYRALRDRFVSFDADALAFKYPACASVIRNSIGVLVHSEYSKNLTTKWFGGKFSSKLTSIPLAREKAQAVAKNDARVRLGIDLNAFVVCSFGILGPTKHNEILLDAWIKSVLSADSNSLLIFVGQKSFSESGVEFDDLIRGSGRKKQILITGYVSDDVYKLYLSAADIAVQLRTQSRGETSAAVLDCMNFGVPVIINAHGSMSEIDSNAVYMLPDEFEIDELIQALDKLKSDLTYSSSLSRNSQKIIHTLHSPQECASKYYEEIEKNYLQNADAVEILGGALADAFPGGLGDEDLISISRSASLNHPKIRPNKRILLDVTVVSDQDYKTGIQRVVRALARELMIDGVEGYSIELVRISNLGGNWHLRTASKYALTLLDCYTDDIQDFEIEPSNGDIFIGLDLSGSYLIEAENSGLFKFFQDQGVSCYAVVYDILPITMPEVFPIYAANEHAKWARSISRFNGAIAISKSVAQEFRQWQLDSKMSWSDRRPYKIGWMHLGADFENSSPTFGIPEDGKGLVLELSKKLSFLMVGTIEPRKGYLEVIQAFTLLWNEGLDVNLVIVGKEGWVNLDASIRRDIPETIQAIHTHPELNKHLYWLSSASDEYLDEVYKASACLIAASYGEGFGLPLIEAAKNELPIIARDIPVFREVAGECALYYASTGPDGLANAIKKWIELKGKNNIPSPKAMQYQTWGETVIQLREFLES